MSRKCQMANNKWDVTNELSGSRTQKSDTANTEDCHWTWSSSSFIHFPSSHPVPLSSVPLVSPFLSTWLLSERFLYQNSGCFSCLPCPSCVSGYSLLNFTILTVTVKWTCNEIVCIISLLRTLHCAFVFLDLMLTTAICMIQCLDIVYWTSFQIQVKLFWVVTLEDRGSVVLQNIGILPQHYTALKPPRPWEESSLPWKPKILPHSRLFSF